ncbi:PH domain-containing protein [Aeromicrobium sp. CF4.19]|uniref:PH domain-containing protein n=1 Tax=Aeromicrobium sp. CF4.19 TaxID=3373082 RepID=UPI003EE6F0AE
MTVQDDTPEVVVERDEPLDVDVPWHRLSGRMIAVDLAVTVLSIAPSVVAFVFLGVDLTWGSGGPLLGLAVLGVGGAAADALRWVTTRYRLTEEHLERSTGLFVRRYRSIRRDRVRSVDTDAKLRHRLAGLRVVLVGAGQQSAASESALSLDAVVRDDAERLRNRLLRSREPATDGSEPDEDRPVVLARFRLRWIVYNVVGVWAFLMAAGLVWGGTWFLGAFGLDVVGWSAELVGWGSLDWVTRVLLGVVVLLALGVPGMAVAYVTSFWRFELSRVTGAQSTALRTRHGLFRTREVNRDDRRLRGLMISEPVVWRWMRMADTEVITTGLSIWSANQPATILPRGPLGVARSVGSRVLGATPDPVTAPLERQPPRALRRRLVWATTATAGAVVVLAWVALLAPVPGWVWWVPVVGWPLVLGAAVVAYRALGYAVVGAYAVVRSGFVSRRTAVLQCSAVSTIVLRESLLQRRLRLRTVTLATAAGWGGYSAPDLDAEVALAFAVEAAPGLLDGFVEGSWRRPEIDTVDP